MYNELIDKISFFVHSGMSSEHHLQYWSANSTAGCSNPHAGENDHRLQLNWVSQNEFKASLNAEHHNC